MRSLTNTEINSLMDRFPDFELSYETISHKKVSEKYDICIAVPNGKKCFAWFTFLHNKDVCIIFDLNKDKRIIQASIIETLFHKSLSLGTLLYGVIHDSSFFVIEDIFYYKGISLYKTSWSHRLGFLYDFLEKQIVQKFENSENGIVFGLPILWYNKQNEPYEATTDIPTKYSNQIPYQIHHIQFRSLNTIMPYLNISFVKKLNLSSNNNKVETYQYYEQKYRMDFSKPQYKVNSVFHVIADIQFDIYYLFAYGKNKELVYYNVACIPDYKTSVFMNKHYRKIKENYNLDYIEESDDEEDFQNTENDKYVDLKKILHIECIFNYKFKKWIPYRILDRSSKVVHISQLVSNYH